MILKIKEYDVIVDDRMVKALLSYSWAPVKKGGNIYFRTTRRLEKTKKTLYLHRLVHTLETGYSHLGIIDHKNRNTLDNRVENLRGSSIAENTRNTRMLSTNTSGFKGIRAKGKKWVAEITFMNKKYVVAKGDSKEELFVERLKYVRALHGDFSGQLIK